MNPLLSNFISQTASTPRAHRRLLEETSPGHYDLCIDNTTLEKLLTCPRSFEIYAVMGRDSGERDALNYGSAIHSALEVFYKGGSLDDSIAALHAAFDAKPCSPGSWRNFDHALASVRQYYHWRQQLSMIRWEPIGLDKTCEQTNQIYQVPAVEVPFKVKLFEHVKDFGVIMYPPKLVSNIERTEEGYFDDTTGEQIGFLYKSITVYWTGKIDLLIEQDGKKKVLDHKTTSMKGDTFWGQFRLSSQFRGYCWAASELLGEPVRHAIIDAIVGRAPTLKGKGNEHENEFQEFEYTDQQIIDWTVDTTEHIQRILHYLSKGYFPQSNAWCFNKYGKCPYFDACAMSPRAGAQLLMSGQYAERTWNPLTA